MTDSMNVLYNYAEEHMVSGLLRGDSGYADARLCAEQGTRELRTLIGEEHEEQLEAWMDEQNLLAFFHSRALFRAGFLIALELAR